MDVSVLLDPTIDLPRLAEILDGLGHEGRVHASRSWNKPRQKAIYEAAKGQPIDLDFFVPPSVGPLVEVIHDLHNTLPVFSNSQKRFCKLEGEDFLIGGYNHASTNSFTGPGYFVVRMADAKDGPDHDGEVAIDYNHLPKHKPASWPDIAPNEGLIGGLVYGRMIDFMHKVSTHVAIGRAHKGKAMNEYFTLVRKDVA